MHIKFIYFCIGIYTTLLSFAVKTNQMRPGKIKDWKRRAVKEEEQRRIWGRMCAGRRFHKSKSTLLQCGRLWYKSRLKVDWMWQRSRICVKEICKRLEIWFENRRCGSEVSKYHTGGSKWKVKRESISFPLYLYGNVRDFCYLIWLT